MPEEVKQNTAGDVTVGPILSSVDGLTRKTTLTLGGITCNLFKGATAVSITLVASGGGGADRNFVHVANGMWKLGLIAGDKDTLGSLKIDLGDATQIAPVWEELSVVDANYYDSKYGSTLRMVNATQIEGADASEAIAAALLNAVMAGYTTAGSLAVWLREVRQRLAGKLRYAKPTASRILTVYDVDGTTELFRTQKVDVDANTEGINRL